MTPNPTAAPSPQHAAAVEARFIHPSPAPVATNLKKLARALNNAAFAAGRADMDDSATRDRSTRLQMKRQSCMQAMLDAINRLAALYPQSAPAVAVDEASLRDALAELLWAIQTEIPPYEAGQEAQEAWSSRRLAARNNAARILAAPIEAEAVKVEAAPSPQAALQQARDALTGWMDQPDTPAAYDASMERAIAAVAAIDAALAASQQAVAEPFELAQDAEQLAAWLENQFKRHGEIEDRLAAEMLRDMAKKWTSSALAPQAVSEPPAGVARDRLQGAIMNLPETRESIHPGLTAAVAYKLGHRDARHAACALVGATHQAAEPAASDMVLVPREPTLEMYNAALIAYQTWLASEEHDSTFTHSDTYRAMIAAATSAAHEAAPVPEAMEVGEDTRRLDWLERESGEDIDNVEVWACWPAKHDRLRDAIDAARAQQSKD